MWAAGDNRVTRGTGQVRPEQVPALLVGLVHDADRDGQPAVAEKPDRGQPAILGGRQRWQQLIQRGRRVQRRQPHLVRRRALPGQLGHHDIQHAGFGDGLLRLVLDHRRRRLG